MNPLATKWGRLLTFFFLYITEGIPLGFTATVMATQMRRSGMGTEEIGLFVASLYFPWGWKWAAGPFVDLLYSNRLGRRRAWIVGTQLLMVISLMACLPFDLVSQFAIVSVILFIHNSCCAVQDVAIDALACESLRSDERGLGNGLMFAGQALGQTIGGAGVLYLMSYLVGEDGAQRMAPDTAFRLTYWFVAACLVVITLCVSLPIREQAAVRAKTSETPLKAAKLELIAYVKTAIRSFFGSQTAFIGLMIACLPAGAAALGLALQSNVAIELGFSDTDIADLAMYSTIVQAGGCFLGGVISDYLGRRKTLSIFLILCSLPTAWLGYGMHQHGWILPIEKPAAVATTNEKRTETKVDSKTPETTATSSEKATPKDVATQTTEQPASTRKPPQDLVRLFWVCCIFYAAMYGLMTGSQIPVFMEITNPAVAATQFTAYMALHNLATSYTAAWQGYSIKWWGYPTTLWIDATIGLIGIALFPFLILKKRTDEEVAVQRDADLGHPA